MKSKLLKLIKKNKFNTSYARSKGVSPRMLSYYVQLGLLVRLAQGSYAFPDKLSFDFEGLVKEKLLQAPRAVVGLYSALKLYGITDESPQVIDLFIPETNVPKKKIEDVHFHTIKNHLYAEGLTKFKGIRITSLERTIVDVIRKQGTISQGLQILHEAQKKGFKIDFSEILRLGALFRVTQKTMGVVGRL